MSTVQAFPGPLPALPPTGDVPPQDVREVLTRCGALLTGGHFLLTSGRHSDRFYLLPLVLQYPEAVRYLAAALARRLLGSVDLTGLDAVVGPAMGGVLLAHELAAQLGVRSMYAEKEPDGSMRLRRGFRLPPGGRAVVVEDAVTTGGSVAKTIAAVTAQGATVAAVAAVVHRGRVQPAFSVSFLPLLDDPAPDWAAGADCPLFAGGVALTRPKQ